MGKEPAHGAIPKKNKVEITIPASTKHRDPLKRLGLVRSRLQPFCERVEKDVTSIEDNEKL